MNKYSLSRYPAAYYRALFDQAPVVMRPAVIEGHYEHRDGAYVGVPDRSPTSRYFEAIDEQGRVAIKAEDLEFDIYLEACNAAVLPDVLQSAKDVMMQIVDMDAAARVLMPQTEYEEELVYVDITRSEIELHYCLTTVNAEWGMIFVRKSDGMFAFEHVA